MVKILKELTDDLQNLSSANFHVSTY